MVPTFVNGLPLHPLVIHAVVVLVPLAVLGGIAIAVWPTARRRFGWLVVGVAAAATASIPLATSTGEGLKHSLPQTRLIERHAHLADQLLPFVVVMLVAVIGLQLVDTLRSRGSRHGEQGVTLASKPLVRPVAVLCAALTVLAAVASAVQVVRIGDTGAAAAWSHRHYIGRGTDRSVHGDR